MPRGLTQQWGGRKTSPPQPACCSTWISPLQHTDPAWTNRPSQQQQQSRSMLRQQSPPDPLVPFYHPRNGWEPAGPPTTAPNVKGENERNSHNHRTTCFGDRVDDPRSGTLSCSLVSSSALVIVATAWGSVHVGAPCQSSEQIRYRNGERFPLTPLVVDSSAGGSWAGAIN